MYGIVCVYASRPYGMYVCMHPIHMECMYASQSVCMYASANGVGASHPYGMYVCMHLLATWAGWPGPIESENLTGGRTLCLVAVVSIGPGRRATRLR